MSGMILETESRMAQQRTDQQRRVKLIKWEESTGDPFPSIPKKRKNPGQGRDLRTNVRRHTA